MIKAPCDKYNKAIPAVNNLYKKNNLTPHYIKKTTSITLTPHEAMNFQSECTDCLAIRTWTKNLVQQCCTAKTTWLKWPRVQVTAVNFRTHVVWLEEIQNTIIYHLSTSSQSIKIQRDSRYTCLQANVHQFTFINLWLLSGFSPSGKSPYWVFFH